MTTMRAALFRGQGQVALEDVATPTPDSGQLLIRVSAAGVCGSDAAEYRYGSIMTKGMEQGHPVTGRTLPVVFGHEFAGTVVEVGRGVDKSRIGQLISCGAGVSCGACAYCQEGRTNLCKTYFTHGFHVDGGLAEYVAVPASIAVDAGGLGLSGDAAALGQPMSIAVHSVRRGRVRAGEHVVVVGVGGIGAFIVHAAAALGAHVLAIDVDPNRLQLAEALGAEVTAQAGPEVDLKTMVTEARWNPDVLFEVTGRGEVLREALGCLEPGKRLVLVGIHKVATELVLAGLSLGELELIGTNAHVCATDLPTALEILAARRDGWADVAPTVRPLSQVISHALEPLAEGHPLAIKSLFDPAAANERPAKY